jgi:hypothetical protein
MANPVASHFFACRDAKVVGPLEWGRRADLDISKDANGRAIRSQKQSPSDGKGASIAAREPDMLLLQAC